MLATVFQVNCFVGPVTLSSPRGLKLSTTNTAYPALFSALAHTSKYRLLTPSLPCENTTAGTLPLLA